jgi:hypothetical protein
MVFEYFLFIFGSINNNDFHLHGNSACKGTPFTLSLTAEANALTNRFTVAVSRPNTL